MDYKVQSTITLGVLAVFMIFVGFAINNLEVGITGAVVQPICDCAEDSDCEDSNYCTEDICLYQDSCEASLCINKQIENCN